MEIGTIMLIITIWAIFGAFIYTLINIEIFNTGRPTFPSPNAIYRTTRLNYTFSIITSILMMIICPYLYLIGIIRWMATK